MAQHDYSIANATGLNFRTDINAAMSAIVTQNSGSSAPAPAFPGMLWLDLSGGGDGIMRRRNQANNAWLTDIGVDQTARNAAAAAQAKADRALLRDGTATVAERTMALPIVLPNTVPAGHEAVSRTQADLLYQVKLPATTAGSLLVGAASGWAAVLPPAADGGLIVQSGGVPIWQAPATVAAPNSIVKTKSDGTIDASFIPSVASGLKYCGTFKPVVNDEYPAAGDNGHGAGGAPAIGDFWVVDGLTTGGYTYLTGSLAGVTVYNGDSIAYDGVKWFRMGNTVDLAGYMKLDGSTAMAGDLNMGSHAINNISGLVGRAGPQVPLSNFFIDQTSILISPQRGTTGADLPAMATGQIGTDLGRVQIFVGAGGANVGLLAVRFFSATASYATGEYVCAPDGRMYRAKQAISAGAFTASQWSAVIDSQGGTFTGPITVDANTAQIIIKNGAWTYNFALGSDGKFYLSDTANSTYAWFYEATTGTRFRGRVMADADLFTKSGFVCSEAGHIVLAVNTTTAAPGTVYLRPNGINEALGQAILRGTTGQFETAGDLYSGGKVVATSGVFASGIGSTIVANNSAGTIYLRPNGSASAAGELTVGASGQVVINGFLFSTVGEFRSIAGATVLGCNGGNIYFRPNSDATSQGVYTASGNLSIPGTMSAANVPASDERLKENITPVATRDLSSLASLFKAFNFIGQTAPQRGPLAQDVLAVAPEYVIEYECIDPAFEFDTLAEGESPPMVMRYTLNYGGLAIEMALNALDRIAAIEAAMAAPPPTRTKQ
jgi:hypothetical protein